MGIYARYVLPRVIDLACGQACMDRQRAALLPRARGRVVEIGFGTGLNLPHYERDAVAELWAVEPSSEIWELGRRRWGRAAPSVVPRHVAAGAERVPLDDGVADTVVVTYTLCSIAEVEVALREMRRLLKPSGQLLFCEHGAAPEPGVRRWQRRLNPLWGRLGGGCRLDREIPELIAGAGFDVVGLETGYLPGWRPASFNFRGWATPGG